VQADDQIGEAMRQTGHVAHVAPGVAAIFRIPALLPVRRNPR